MKKMNKKGFTIVELVIVIAVIAILAAVMIPTFSGIIGKANASAAQQKAAAAFKEIYARDLADGKCDGWENSDTAQKVDLKGSAAGTYEYTPSETPSSVSFIYRADGYVATFNGTAWSVVDAE